jgi:hypothetical protein
MAILMKKTPQISIVPTNDGDRCSILLTIAERLANDSPSTTERVFRVG